jgi:ankyrin repeat protein
MQSRSVAQARVSSNSFDMYDVYAQCDDEDTSAQGPAYLQEGVVEQTLPAPELPSSRNGSLREEFSIEVAGEVLLAAVERLDVEEVTRLLAEHPKIAKAQDRMGQTALHLACRAGVVTLVEALLDFNVYVDATDFGGKTPLHVSRNAAVVRLLCNEGASVNKPDEAGLVPLHEYVLCESLECVDVVLSFGASPVVAESTNLRSAIHMAADLGNYEMLSLLVQESTAVINYDQPDVDGFTALQLAASCDRETGGQLKIFMLLLNRGASAVLSNERGISPLHLICANRSLSRQLLAEPIVELLLGLQADPNAQDVDGCTPLIVACAYREWGLCKLLLEAGGDLNIPCTMNSIFLQGDTRISFSKDKNDIKTVALMENSDCTASDLMTKGARHNLFGSISVAQTRIPGETRDRCMNCAATFGGDTSSFGSMFRISSGKHHCRLCLRVVCQDCSQQELPRSQMPDFVQNSNTESSMRVCLVCCSVLKHRVASTEPKKAGFWG